MNDQPQLTPSEWQLVAELLEHERRELHPEIRHTRTARVRDDLHDRLEHVEQLLAKLQPVANIG